MAKITINIDDVQYNLIKNNQKLNMSGLIRDLLDQFFKKQNKMKMEDQNDKTN